MAAFSQATPAKRACLGARHCHSLNRASLLIHATPGVDRAQGMSAGADARFRVTSDAHRDAIAALAFGAPGLGRACEAGLPRSPLLSPRKPGRPLATGTQGSSSELMLRRSLSSSLSAPLRPAAGSLAAASSSSLLALLAHSSATPRFAASCDSLHAYARLDLHSKLQ